MLCRPDCFQLRGIANIYKSGVIFMRVSSSKDAWLNKQGNLAPVLVLQTWGNDVYLCLSSSLGKSTCKFRLFTYSSVLGIFFVKKKGLYMDYIIFQLPECSHMISNNLLKLLIETSAVPTSQIQPITGRHTDIRCPLCHFLKGPVWKM